MRLAVAILGMIVQYSVCKFNTCRLSDIGLTNVNTFYHILAE